MKGITPLIALFQSLLFFPTDLFPRQIVHFQVIRDGYGLMYASRNASSSDNAASDTAHALSPPFDQCSTLYPLIENDPSRGSPGVVRQMNRLIV
jgi:hypothetical protein